MMTTPLPPPPPLPPRMTWVPTLDGLRGLAVLAVVAFHAGHLDGGYLGVDLFFTVSGFLITRLILDDLGRGRFSLARFWGRRARRLLPALWLLLAVLMLFSPWLVERSTGLSLRRSGLQRRSTSPTGGSSAGRPRTGRRSARRRR